MRDRLQFLSECARGYGETVGLHIIRPTLLINNPDDVVHVLVDNIENYKKNWRETGPAGAQRPMPLPR